MKPLKETEVERSQCHNELKIDFNIPWPAEGAWGCEKINALGVNPQSIGEQKWWINISFLQLAGRVRGHSAQSLQDLSGDQSSRDTEVSSSVMYHLEPFPPSLSRLSFPPVSCDRLPSDLCKFMFPTLLVGKSKQRPWF